MGVRKRAMRVMSRFFHFSRRKELAYNSKTPPRGRHVRVSAERKSDVDRERARLAELDLDFNAQSYSRTKSPNPQANTEEATVSHNLLCRDQYSVSPTIYYASNWIDDMV